MLAANSTLYVTSRSVGGTPLVLARPRVPRHIASQNKPWRLVVVLSGERRGESIRDQVVADEVRVGSAERTTDKRIS